MDAKDIIDRVVGGEEPSEILQEIGPPGMLGFRSQASIEVPLRKLNKAIDVLRDAELRGEWEAADDPGTPVIAFELDHDAEYIVDILKKFGIYAKLVMRSGRFL